MNKNNITVEEEQELFDKGIVIRRNWIMPGAHWEYYAIGIGDIHSQAIAIKSTPRAVYNAVKRWLMKQ